MTVGSFSSICVFTYTFKIYSSALTMCPKDLRANKHKHDVTNMNIRVWGEQTLKKYIISVSFVRTELCAYENV